MKKLESRIKDRTAFVSIIGLGYVGLPLAIEFIKKGFSVNGIDLNPERINSIKRGNSYILDVNSRDLKSAGMRFKFKVGRSYKPLRRSDVIIVCVPTPLRKSGEPDLSYILDSAREIKRYLKKDTLVILESTTYPGTTEEIILPILSRGGYKVGRDFYLAFSPERVDPGNKDFRTSNIPKIIGGVTKNCLELAQLLYKQIVKEVVAVSSPRVAEMVKLLENSFRSVNIALANETALICNRVGINVWEVIKAAKTKPFGFIPFYPGPGIGGHCIPTDPMYLIWKARLSGYEPRLIRTAHEVNSFMPHYIVERVITSLNVRGRSSKNANILIVGVTYKPDVNDIRESPALEVIEELIKKKAQIYYYDPYVKKLALGKRKYKAILWKENNISKMDCVVIVTNHSSVNYSVLKKAKLIIDTRDALNWKSKNLIKI